MNTPVVVSTSDKYSWALAPFAHLFQKYVGPDCQVNVAGYTPVDFPLPRNFSFYSIATPQYPKERWVDGFLKFLYQYDEPFFVLMLEDYWLCRTVDTKGIDILHRLISNTPDLIRIDLTADRLYAGGMYDIGYYERFDLVESPKSQYQMSLQAGIWNRKLLIELLEQLPGELRSAWYVELEGTTILNKTDLRVFGTRQLLMRYVNGMNNAKSSEINFAGFTDFDREAIQGIIQEVKK